MVRDNSYECKRHDFAYDINIIDDDDDLHKFNLLDIVFDYSYSDVFLNGESGFLRLQFCNTHEYQEKNLPLR